MCRRRSVCQHPAFRHQQSYKNSILPESAFYGRGYENPHCLIEDANKKPAFNLLCRAHSLRTRENAKSVFRQQQQLPASRYIISGLSAVKCIPPTHLMINLSSPSLNFSHLYTHVMWVRNNSRHASLNINGIEVIFTKSIINVII